MAYTPVAKEEIWRIADLISSGTPIPLEALEGMVATLQDHRIELFARPSKRPGDSPLVFINADGSEREEWFRGASPKQIEFQTKFFDRKGKERTAPTYYCIAGGNRAAKSIACWAMCFCLDIRDYAKDGDVFWAIAPTEKKLIDDVQEWIWQYLPRYMFGDRIFNKENGFGANKTLELKLPGRNGTCKLLFKTEEQMVTNPGVFEASSVNGIAWTEARYEPLVTALRSRVLDKRGYILVDYLPCEGWMQNRFELNPNVFHMTFGMLDNQHNLPPGEVQKFIVDNAHDPDTVALRVYGKPRAMMGVVIGSFDRVKHWIPKFKIPDWWPLYLAGDWGYDHPHAFALAAVAPNEDIFIIDEQYQNKMFVEDVVIALWNMIGRYRPLKHDGFASPTAMFAKIRKILNTKRVNIGDDRNVMYADPDNSLIDYVRNQIVGDGFSVKGALATSCAIDNQVFQERGEGRGMTLAREFMEMGFPVKKAIKGEIEWSVEQLRRRFHDGKMFLFDNCPNLRRDLSSWKYKRGNEGQVVGSKDRYEEQYKDGADAVRYLVQMKPTHHASMDDAA